MALGLALGLGLGASSGPRTTDRNDMPRRYLFIDGAFFRLFLNEMKAAAMTEHGELEIELSAVGSRFDRVFFYDAYPERREGQSDESFEHEITSAERYFNQIATTQNFSVRPALTRRGQRRQQKGVDVLLAIECLLHAVRSNIDEAAIMTSDLDFFPLLEALLQTKTKSLLRYQIEKTAPELIQAADYAVPLTFADFNEWVAPNYRPVRGTRGVNEETIRSGQLVAHGTVENRPLKLLRGGVPEGYFATVDGRPIGGIADSRLFVEGEVERQLRAKIQYVVGPNSVTGQ